MSEDQVIAVFGTLGAVILVGFAVGRRKLGSRRLFYLAVIWVGIIVSAWSAVTLALRYISNLT